MKLPSLDQITASHAFTELLDSAAATRTRTGPLRVAVKANIDVAGHVTTCGSRLIQETGKPAKQDADCVAMFRQTGAIIVGITNMNQLAFGSYGNNQDFNDVLNPVDERLISGGSSSGSAASVANGWADIALGTDTGGSIRIPAACQGVAGLKPTFGLISLRGVQPLAESFDTVGPIARDITGLETGMQLLHDSFEPDLGQGPTTIGRLMVDGIHERQNIEIDNALRRADFHDVVDIDNSVTRSWDGAVEFTSAIMRGEMYRVYARYDDGQSYSRFDTRIVAALEAGKLFESDGEQRRSAYRHQRDWAARLQSLLDEHGVVALPTLAQPVPSWAEVKASPVKISHLVNPVNAAGLPAVTLPVARTGGHPVGIQLIGRPNCEATLLATARRIELATHSEISD